MAKKTSRAPKETAAAKKPKTTITVEIDDQTAILQTATVVARRGNDHLLRQFQFSNTAQLAAHLIAIERELVHVDSGSDALASIRAASSQAAGEVETV